MPKAFHINGAWSCYSKMLKRVLVLLVSSFGISLAAEPELTATPALTNIQQILSLRLTTEDIRVPAHVLATVTYAEDEPGLWFIKDESSGVYLMRQSNDPHLKAGFQVDIVGEARKGHFAPILVFCR
jgi:hypothetical protein